MIVPGGGLSADSAKWIACRRDFFLSVRVLFRLYRRLILDGLARLHGAGKLHFFGDHADLVDRATFDAFLRPLRRIDWVVYAKKPFAGPSAVLAYLSRYTHRVAISNSRLTRMDDQGVTFRVKDYRVSGPGRPTTMTLKSDEFFRRFLIHVLPKGQHRIRHYGLFGNGIRAASITRIRNLLGTGRPDPGHTEDGTADNADAPARVLALPCPCCGGRMIIVETVAPEHHARAPPGTARAAARYAHHRSELQPPPPTALFADRPGMPATWMVMVRQPSTAAENNACWSKPAKPTPQPPTKDRSTQRARQNPR